MAKSRRPPAVVIFGQVIRARVMQSNAVPTSASRELQWVFKFKGLTWFIYAEVVDDDGELEAWVQTPRVMVEDDGSQLIDKSWSDPQKAAAAIERDVRLLARQLGELTNG